MIGFAISVVVIVILLILACLTNYRGPGGSSGFGLFK